MRKAGAGYQFSVTADDVVYVSGQCRPVPGQAPRINLKEIAARCPDVKKDGPKNVRQRGHFDFGPRWHSLREIAFGPNECLGLVELQPEYRSETQTYNLHPALMDIATGVAMYLIPGYDKPGDLLLPFAYNKLTLYRPLPARVYSHTRLKHDAGSDLVSFDLTLANEQGEVIAEIEEFTVKRLRSVQDLAHLEPLRAPGTGAASSEGKSLTGIATKEGLEAFHRVMKSADRDVVYVTPKTPVPALQIRDTVSPTDSAPVDNDDVDQALAKLWHSVLGLDQIDAKTDFFDSGGNSLLAIRLFADIRKRFNVNFGLSTLFEARTVGALADLIRQARETGTPEVAFSSDHSMVTIRAGGANTPLFLIHDVNGSIIRYEHVARHFPESQPVFAIEPVGMRGKPLDYTVEAMATHYIKQIRERQPHGPYFVAGHSFGGLVAYEIACQLAAQNETMGIVGLFDTFQENIIAGDELLQDAPTRVRAPFFLLKEAAAGAIPQLRVLLFGNNRIGYLSDKKNALMVRVVARITRMRYRLTYALYHRLGRTMPPELTSVKEADWIASDNYRPGHYEGGIVLFRCADRIETDPPDSSRLWQRLAKGGVTILDIPGDHNSILKEPGAQILAEHLLGYLKPKSANTTITL